jgi:hypothetical protein
VHELNWLLEFNNKIALSPTSLFRVLPRELLFLIKQKYALLYEKI